MNTTAVLRNDNSILIRGANLYISEIDGNVAIVVEIDNKRWGFGKRKDTIDTIIASLKASGIVPVDVSGKTGQGTKAVSEHE